MKIRTASKIIERYFDQKPQRRHLVRRALDRLAKWCDSGERAKRRNR